MCIRDRVRIALSSIKGWFWDSHAPLVCLCLHFFHSLHPRLHLHNRRAVTELRAVCLHFFSLFTFFLSRHAPHSSVYVYIFPSFPPPPYPAPVAVIELRVFMFTFFVSCPSFALFTYRNECLCLRFFLSRRCGRHVLVVFSSADRHADPCLLYTSRCV